jgi:drug/metabolite transporter (DMT)-like permease
MLPRMNRQLLRGSVGAAAAMFAVGTLAASASVISRYPLYGGQAMRYALAALILLAVARARGLRQVRLTAREALLLLALAATGLAGFNLCVIQATRHASPALVGTIVGTVPVVLALAGPLLARSRPSGRVLLAAFVVVVGATITTGLGSGGAIGLLYSIGALACEACFSLLAIPLLPRLGPVRVSAYTQVVAVPLLLVAGVLADGGGLLRMPTAAEAAALAYLGVVVSAGAFLLWYDALPRLGADRAGLFAGMVPVGAIVTTVLLGLGTPTASELLGAAVVVAGLAMGLTSGRPRPRTVAPAAARSHEDPTSREYGPPPPRSPLRSRSSPTAVGVEHGFGREADGSQRRGAGGLAEGRPGDRRADRRQPGLRPGRLA